MFSNEHFASAGSCILTVAHWCLDVKGCLQRFLWFPPWEVSICIHVLFWIQVQVNFAEICIAMYWLVKPQVVAVNAFSDSSLSETGGVAPRCEDQLPSPPSHSLKKGSMVPILEDMPDSLPWSGCVSLPHKGPCQGGQNLLESSRHNQMWSDLLP